MNETQPTKKFPQWLLFAIGGAVLLTAIGLAVWAVGLQKSISTLQNQSTEVAAQLTVEGLVEEQMENHVTEEPQTTSQPTSLPPTLTPQPTNPPTATPDLLTSDNFSQISFEFVPEVYELSDQTHYLIPPLHLLLPEEWSYVFEDSGKLTIAAPNEAETQLYLQMKNTATGAIFNLNEIGKFWYMATGDLAWYPPNFKEVPFDLSSAEYEILIQINSQDYFSKTFILEEAPQARILQSAPMYRTLQDIVDKQRYRSFGNQQEAMPMLGFNVQDDGRIYVRLWRQHDEEFYWINGEYVMHPDLPIAYNTLEDFQDEAGNWLIPEIKLP